jgi:AraC-like DNA-binding protein
MYRKPCPRSADHLEGQSEGPVNRIRIGHGGMGIERLEACFAGQAFSPHRHDTYAIGVTLSGVQTFRYRGAQRVCLPGQCHVLHPDEMHDGSAGTAEGFGYRIVYIDPSLIQRALGGRALPFVSDAIVERRVFQDALPRALWRLEEPIDDVARIEIATAVADFLDRASGTGAQTQGSGKQSSLRHASLLRVRDLIAANPTIRHSVATLEGVSGLDRWVLARQFRAAFGTCPSQFRTMRQLDDVRRRIRSGRPLAEAALDAGFADQSHMSRMFKRAYGLTPAKWASALVRHG